MAMFDDTYLCISQYFEIFHERLGPGLRDDINYFEICHEGLHNLFNILKYVYVYVYLCI